MKNIIRLLLCMVFVGMACSPLPKGVVSKATQISKKGIMQECTFYLNGKPVAKSLFDATGALVKTEGKIPDGLVKHLFVDNVVSMELTYQNNKKNGPYKVFSREGRLLAEGAFQDDQPHGIIKTYNEQGLLTLERSYQDGELHGPSRWLYEDGSIQVEKNYRQGVEHGTFVWKDKKGKVTATEVYKNGKKIK
ncbi:toxin-antitoxin system YwqK family antitoxin [candidate division FCPU426 bacterium]|nr:toxin-antitoxin system YwqK family antitoxin [candidate division FCPU426 bacterium]